LQQPAGLPHRGQLIEGLLVARIALAPVQPFLQGAVIRVGGVQALQPVRGHFHALQAADILRGGTLAQREPPLPFRRAEASAGARPSSRRRQYIRDRKSTRLNSSHVKISYAVFCLKKKKKDHQQKTEYGIYTILFITI